MAERKKVGRAKVSKSKKTEAAASSQKTLLDLFGRPQQPLIGTPAEPDMPGPSKLNAEAVVDHASEPEPVALFRPEWRSPPKTPPKKLFSIFEKPPPPRLASPVYHEIPDESPPGSSKPQSPIELLPSPSPMPLNAATVEGSSRDDPIIVASSPIKPPPLPVPAFFAKRSTSATLNKTSSLPTLKGEGKARAANLPPPFPEQLSQHARGPQTEFSAPPLTFQRRKPVVNYSEKTMSFHSDVSWLQPAYDIFQRQVSQLLPCSSVPSYPDRIKRIKELDQRAHPALVHLIDVLSSQDPAEDASSVMQTSQRPWADKWRPDHAAQVLGNEERAVYLRDWLQALELHLELPQNRSSGNQGKKVPKKASKRPVVRAVDKAGRRRSKRRRIDFEDDDNWIVNDDDEIEEAEPLEDIEDDLPLLSNSSAHSPTSSLADLSTHPVTPLLHSLVASETVFDFSYRVLSNTMILAGPPGCGKTAAVFACAEELGWEVFEVYPGIGKRNGTNMDHLVGDVGKNHLVAKWERLEPGSPVKKNALSGFFKKGTTREKADSGDDGFGFVNTRMTPLPDAISLEADQSSAVGVRQSMILLEEVDILFKEDINFWPAVVNLIKDCKRPVVMTCNDISLIPAADLPLETVLEFEPCPSALSVDYLRALCLAEGYLIDQQQLVGVYQTTCELHPLDIHSEPINPLSVLLPKSDLRRSINSLQLWCSNLEQTSTAVPLGSNPTPHHSHPIPAVGTHSDQSFTLPSHADLISFFDSESCRGCLTTTEALSLSACEQSVDDELGHTILFQPSLSAEHLHTLTYHVQDEHIARAATRLSYTTSKLDSSHESLLENMAKESLFLARASYQSKMLKVLGNVVSTSSPSRLRTRPATFLDYVPWIRHMVEVEDASEAAIKSGCDVIRRTSTKRRSTRLERPLVYERILPMSTDLLQILSETRLNLG